MLHGSWECIAIITIFKVGELSTGRCANEPSCGTVPGVAAHVNSTHSAGQSSVDRDGSQLTFRAFPSRTLAGAEHGRIAFNRVVPEHLFTRARCIALVGAPWAWIIIMLRHRSYCTAVAADREPAVSYRIPFARIANRLVAAFLPFVSAMPALDSDTRVALYVAPFWFGPLWIGYACLKPAPGVDAA